jgi:hypothetical protein
MVFSKKLKSNTTKGKAAIFSSILILIGATIFLLPYSSLVMTNLKDSAIIFGFGLMYMMIIAEFKENHDDLKGN